MRHQKAFRKFSRTPSHRRALFSNMAAALITHGRIRTTEAKAKELRSVVERLVTLGKKGTLATRRQAYAMLRHEAPVTALFGDLAERFKDRAGGYTRVLKLGRRHGDNAPMSFLEFVDYEPTTTSDESEE